MNKLMQNLEDAKSALTEAMNGTDAEAIKSATEQVKAAKAALDAANEGEALIKSLGTNDGKAEPEVKAKTLGEKAAKTARNLGLSKGLRGNFVLYKTDPAAMDSPGAASSGALTQLAQDIDRNIVPAYREPLVVRDLLGAESITGNALTYFVETADSSVLGGPAYVAEGGAKPMVEMPEPTAVTEALVKVASYYKETDELLEDYAWLASSIDNRALFLHRKWVNNVLLNGTSGSQHIVGLLNRSGIGSTAGTSGTPTAITADNIFKAMMAIEGDSGMTPDAIVINPADYQILRLAKDQVNQYYGGGYFGGQYGNGGFEMYPPIWGLRTVVTSAIASGTCLVGAFRQGASVITKDGGGLRVEMTNSDQNDFVYNRVTVRVEERLALAVRYPKAFHKLVNYSA